MTRRKGEVTTRMNERECPHMIELAHPPDGFGIMLVERMTRFHTERGVAIQRGRRQRREDREYVRFCFPVARRRTHFVTASGEAIERPRTLFGVAMGGRTPRRSGKTASGLKPERATRRYLRAALQA